MKFLKLLAMSFTKIKGVTIWSLLLFIEILI